MGIRCKRFAMIVDDGVVKHLDLRAGGRQGSPSTGASADPRRCSRPEAGRASVSLAGSFGRARFVFFLNGFMPSRASWSARSLASVPAWPRTQCHLTSWRVGGRVEPLPEVDVLDRLPVGGLPAVPLPALDPAGDAAAQILRVGVEIDRRRPLQRLQRRDRRHQLHAVVGGLRPRRPRVPSRARSR